MADSYTTATNLVKPANNDSGWDLLLNGNFDVLDALDAGLIVAATEVPSTTLNAKVSAGSFRASDGTIVDYAGTSSQALTASETNYVYLTDAGVLTVNTTGWPASTWHVRLAEVVTGATAITSISYPRIRQAAAGANGNTVYLALSGGTFADSSAAVVLTTGSTHGVQLGSAATDKLGFWGATPVVRPASASQAAVGTLTTVTLTDSTTGTAGTTLSDVGASFSQTSLNNIHASFVAQINHAVADLGSLKTLVNQLRADLVTLGVLKGSA